MLSEMLYCAGNVCGNSIAAGYLLVTGCRCSREQGKMMLSQDLQVLLIIGACLRLYWAASPPAVWEVPNIKSVSGSAFLNVVSFVDVASAPVLWTSVWWSLTRGTRASQSCCASPWKRPLVPCCRKRSIPRKSHEEHENTIIPREDSRRLKKLRESSSLEEHEEHESCWVESPEEHDHPRGTRSSFSVEKTQSDSEEFHYSKSTSSMLLTLGPQPQGVQQVLTVPWFLRWPFVMSLAVFMGRCWRSFYQPNKDGPDLSAAEFPYALDVATISHGLDGLLFLPQIFALSYESFSLMDMERAAIHHDSAIHKTSTSGSLDSATRKTSSRTPTGGRTNKAEGRRSRERRIHPYMNRLYVLFSLGFVCRVAAWVIHLYHHTAEDGGTTLERKKPAFVGRLMLLFLPDLFGMFLASDMLHVCLNGHAGGDHPWILRMNSLL